MVCMCVFQVISKGLLKPFRGCLNDWNDEDIGKRGPYWDSHPWTTALMYCKSWKMSWNIMYKMRVNPANSVFLTSTQTCTNGRSINTKWCELESSNGFRYGRIGLQAWIWKGKTVKSDITFENWCTWQLMGIPSLESINQKFENTTDSTKALWEVPIICTFICKTCMQHYHKVHQHHKLCYTPMKVT